MIRRLGLLVLTLLVLAPVPAQAGTWSSPDPEGDATTSTFDPEPEPCGTSTEEPAEQGDVRRLTVRHLRDRLVLTVRATGFTSARQLRRASVSFTVVTPGRDLVVGVSRFDGRDEVDVHRRPDFDEDDLDQCGNAVYLVTPRECADAKVSRDLGRGTVRVNLPRACVQSPRWVRVGVQVSSNGPGSSYTSDRWAPRGDDGDFLDPVVGRRVHTSR